MVALYPRPEESEALAVDGGLEADDIHVTLFFLGEVGSFDEDEAKGAVQIAAESAFPLEGKVGGIGEFAASENGKPIILLPSVKGLVALRQAVAYQLEQQAITSPSEHDFVPHMTLMYAPENTAEDDLSGEPEDLSARLGSPLHFDVLSCVIGDERTDYELGASPEYATRRHQMAADKTNEQAASWTLSQNNGTNTLTWGAEVTSTAGGNHLTIMPGRTATGAVHEVLADGRHSTVTTNRDYSAESKEILSSMMADANEQNDDELPMAWEGVLAVEGMPTDDRRYLMPGEIEERDLPLTLMAQTVTDEGHKGAEVAGKITEVWREQRDDLGENAVAVMGRGVFDDSDMGREAARMVRDETLRGVSVDLAVSETLALDPETHEPIDEDFGLEQMLAGNYLTGVKGKIMGATLCAFPAFADASIRVDGAGEGKALVASTFGIKLLPTALTASAAGIAPLKPPREWFETPEPDGPCALTVTDDGRVYGHLATWNQCHTGFPHSCELAPKSRSDYQFFHLGEIETAEGDRVAVGRLTVGEKGHAGLSLGTQGTIDHYDKTGLVAAFVRASNGKHGIWLSGAVRSDCPAEKVRDLRANPPSGDWRWENGGLELVAALAVPVPGYPIVRSGQPAYRAAVVASGQEEHVEALVATGYAPQSAPSRAEQRKRVRLYRAAKELLG